MITACALTGHRRMKDDFEEAALFERLKQLIDDGCKTFYCGMAMGFDLKACECLLKMKKTYDIEIVACVPAPEQPDRYPKQEKERYQRLLSLCDRKHVSCEHMTQFCFFERNRYMVDHCDVLVAYLYEKRGGTAYTVNYARQKGKKILFV